MKAMKHLFIFTLFVCGSIPLFASEETIIDPSLMNKDVWAEPYFRTPGEAPRETASAEGGSDMSVEKSPSQYLDVVAQIPFSEPTMTRSWLEWKILSHE